MLKKYLLGLVVVVFLFGVYNADAFINLSPSRIFGKNVSYTAQVVSANDFSDYIEIVASSTPNTSVTVKGDFGDGNMIAVDGGNGIYTVDSSGSLSIGFTHVWPILDLSSAKKYSASLNLTDSTGQQASASYDVTVSYAPVTLTATNLTTGATISDGGTVSVGDKVDIKCTNGTQLYVNSPQPTVEDQTGASNYILNNNIADVGVVGTVHNTSCLNLGGVGKTLGSTYYPKITFTVVKSGMSATISGNDCLITENNSSCLSTISWSTTTKPIGTSKVTSETDGTGASSPNNIISTGNGSGSKSLTIPYTVLGSHQGRNFYLYNNGEELGKVTVTANCSSGLTWDGSKCVKNNSCPPPIGGSLNSGGVCVCPSGQNDIGGTCGVCPVNSNYDSTNKTCKCDYDGATVGIGGTCKTKTNTNTGPISCSFTDKTFNFVKCTNIPDCEDGSSPVVSVLDGSGSKNVNPDKFDWNKTQYLYQFTCPNGPTIPPYQALTRPYTHFINFNVNAGYVKKGTGINLSWIVQNPTTTCKIIATDIKNGDKLFDTSLDSKYSEIKDSVTKANNPSTALIGVSTGDYKAKMDTYFIVNQSTRFTAICENLVNFPNHYMEGFHQLVRDVYVTDEVAQ